MKGKPQLRIIDSSSSSFFRSNYNTLSCFATICFHSCVCISFSLLFFTYSNCMKSLDSGFLHRLCLYIVQHEKRNDIIIIANEKKTQNWMNREYTSLGENFMDNDFLSPCLSLNVFFFSERAFFCLIFHRRCYLWLIKYG